jgi:hypothetical protein
MLAGIENFLESIYDLVPPSESYSVEAENLASAAHHAQSLSPGILDDSGFHLEVLPRWLPDFSTSETIAGDPHADREWWNWQGLEQSCAVVAQQGVLESILHKDVSQDALVSIAQEQGWYDPECGTPPSCVGNLLEAFDIPVERHVDTTLEELYTALTHGEKVIVGLNAHEIWQPLHSPEGVPLKQEPAGHAVWVTGITVKDNEFYVAVNDSAPLSGWRNEIPLKDFMNAWQDGGNFAVITKLHA